MSTAPVTTENTTPVVHNSANYTSENVTLVVGYTREELAKPEGKRKLTAQTEDKFSEAERDETNTEVDEDGKPVFKFKVIFSQTAIIYHPENLDGVQELVPDDEEKLNLIDSQLKVKQINRFRSLVVSKDFAPQDNTIDMFDECNKKSEKRLSPFEKTQNEILTKFSPEMQAKLLELLQAQVGGRK